MSKQRNRIITFTIISALFLTLIGPYLSSTATAQSENDWYAQPQNEVLPVAAASSPTGLNPTQIKKAYNLPSSGGTGTIAIIDAYDCPTAQNDLATFSTTFGLPTPNLEIHKMSPSIPVDSAWALEISLDIQWAHAIAPNAKILLVEAVSNRLFDLLAAVDYARNQPDVVAISMSWGGNEFSTESNFESSFRSAHGAVFFAASGDSGASVIWPSTSGNVIAVGGTNLNLNPDGTVASETAWSGSGGGLSAYVPEPNYQLTYGISTVGAKRAVPDVSYNANPASGFSVYHTTSYSGQTGWFQIGGTSAGAPQWAAIHSLTLTTSSNNLYQAAKTSYASYFRDITSGSNGAYTAIAGYDYVTGLGSPVTSNYIPALTSHISNMQNFVIQTGANQAHFVYADPHRMTVAAATYDVAAGSIVYGMCQNTQIQCFDNNQLIASQNVTDRGRLLLNNQVVLLFGGPNPHWCVKYLEDKGLTPVYFQNDGASVKFTETATGINKVNHALSKIDFEHEDYFVIMAVTDENNNHVFISYGFDWKGTWASGIYLKAAYSNIQSYTNTYYIFHWQDANINGIPEQNEITQIALG